MTRLATALEASGLPFAAYAWAPPPSGDYGVYAIDAGFSLDAGNGTIETAKRLTIDYFTRSDGENARQAIESALDDAHIPHRLNSVQYEADTRYLHLEWLVTLYG